MVDNIIIKNNNKNNNNNKNKYLIIKWSLLSYSNNIISNNMWYNVWANSNGEYTNIINTTKYKIII